LSSTTASIAAKETGTITITPVDANGVATLLIDSVTAANPVRETFTVTANSATANVVWMAAGKHNLKGTYDLTKAIGASYRPRVNPSSLQVQTAWHTVADQGASATVAQSDTQTVRIENAIDTATRTNRVSALGAKVQGTLASTGETNRLAFDARFADTATSGAPIAPLNVVAGGLLDFAGETLTATGAFTFNYAVSGAGTTTFTIAGGAGTSGVTSSTLTVTTQSYGYASAISFGTAAAVSAAGIGIVAGNQTAAESTATSPSLLTPSTGTAPTDATSYLLSTVTGKTVNLKLHSGASVGTIPVTIAARTGVTLPTGITTGTFNYTTTATTGYETSTTVTLTATAPLAGQGYDVTFNSAANTSITLSFTYEAPAVSSSRGALTMAPAAGTTYKNVVSGTNTLEATVTDQFFDPVSGASVVAVISGRNAQTLTYTTDANGVATVAWTDAGAVLTGSGVTGTTDGASITAQSSNSASATAAKSYTITYSATLTATTLTLTNNSATAGTAVDGDVTFTATVLDANGVALSGYPVVFTGDSKTFFSSKSNTTTAYTNTSGVATAVFQGTTIGSATITATSGGKSATSSYTVLAGTARTISVDAATVAMAPGESKRVTATVKDSYGNVVDAQAVTIAYVGTAGRVASVNGVSSSTGTTDTNGQVVVELTADAAGTGTLTLSFTGGNTSTANRDNGTARPTRVASVTVAATISGTNAAIAAAEAAGDAAAEAIDAANAATDAANLAAEAADAATVAAEEARDAADAATTAVEELATQVATLMAALKAQITTLANTVAKIAKKVKA
jgi:hypothetical protein